MALSTADSSLAGAAKGGWMRLAVDQLPIMSKANCTFLAYGVEAGTQKVLDRLKKNQTLEQIEYAVSEAKRQGIERAHGFFLVGSPGETELTISWKVFVLQPG